MRITFFLFLILASSISFRCAAQQKCTAPVSRPVYHAPISVLIRMKYAVLEEGWFLVNTEDRRHPEQLRYVMDLHGRFFPAGNRFPSARMSGDGEASRQYEQTSVLTHSAGLRPLGDWLHAQSMLFGIQIVRSIPKESVRLDLPIDGTAFHAKEAADESDACPWDPTNWGVDFLKVDCIADHPYKESEIKQIRRTIDKTGKGVVLSLPPGPTSLSHGAAVNTRAEIWRISNDVCIPTSSCCYIGRSSARSSPGLRDRPCQYRGRAIANSNEPHLNL